jgi:hypothetical protein
MSKKDLETFCEMVLNDLNLQKKLSAEKDRDRFFSRVLKLSGELGFNILREEIEQKLMENRRLWNERWI